MSKYSSQEEIDQFEEKVSKAIRLVYDCFELNKIHPSTAMCALGAIYAALLEKAPISIRDIKKTLRVIESNILEGRKQDGR